MFVPLCYVGITRPPSEDPGLYPMSLLLLTHGALLGLAGFCFRPRPDEEGAEYASVYVAKELFEDAAEESSEYATEDS
jgi:hypothetical protein